MSNEYAPPTPLSCALTPFKLVKNGADTCFVVFENLLPMIEIHVPGPIPALKEAPLTADVMTGRKSGEIDNDTLIVCVERFPPNKPVPLDTTTWPLYVPVAIPVGLTPTLTVNGVVPFKGLAVSQGTDNDTVAAN